MTMPKPTLQEDKESFITRCMDNDLMQTEYTNESQRLKVCTMQWDKEDTTKSYDDYPKSASNNAKKALDYKEESGNPNDCGTRVGWTRANQLANRENLTRETIARMASFNRHRQHKDVPYDEGCGGLMWDAWGGTSGIDWAISKLEEIDKKAYTAIIKNNLSYDDYMKTKENKGKQKDTFETMYKDYKAGKRKDAPVLQLKARMKKDGEVYKVVMSKEIVDRDGDIVKLNGCRNLGEPTVFIDAHRQSESVIATRLGTVMNGRIEGDEMVGEIKFVNTEAGNQAKAIAEDSDHPFPVSIGFGVYEYDQNTKTVLDWERYEVSAVNVPANKGSELKTIHEAKQKMDKAKSDAKVLKEYRRIFMSNKLWNLLDIEKGEDELIDLMKVRDILDSKFKQEEAPSDSVNKETEQEAPVKVKKLTYEELRQAVIPTIRNK